MRERLGEVAQLMCPNTESGVWQGTVAYSHAVMEQIRVAAVNGFNAFGHGGLEIGGVLYGERRGEMVASWQRRNSRASTRWVRDSCSRKTIRRPFAS